MKNFLKGSVCAIFCGVMLALSGCFVSFDPLHPWTDTGVKSVDGYKICYNNNEYVLDSTFDDYAKHMMNELFVNFAIPASTEPKTKVEDPPTTTNFKNYDRIRVQVGLDEEEQPILIDNVSWKWTFSQELSGCEIQTELGNVISYYSTRSVQEKYFSEFSKLYTIPLTVVAIEIAMGEEPEVFAIDIQDETTTVKTKSGTVVDNDYLNSVKEKFSSKGLYVGFTEQDVETFKSYFLKEIVGSDIVDDSTYNTIYLLSGETTYQNLIATIMAVPTGLEKEFLSPYPASFVKDINDNSCYGQNSPNTLDHVTALEYHSVVFMMNKTTDFVGIAMGFEATYDLTLNVKVSYYSYQTSTTVELCSQTINVTAGRFQESQWQLLSLEKQVYLNAFNNELVKATSPTQISNLNKNSIYYAYTSSGATLDGQQLGCDYLSVSFNPQKTEQHEYCPFKWVLGSLVMGE